MTPWPAKTRSTTTVSWRRSPFPDNYWSCPPAIRTECCGEKDHQSRVSDVYIDLNAASIAGTKILITDAGANGVRASDDTTDMVDRGAGMLRLDDDPGGQGLSRDEYRSAFAEADEQYARMLRALLSAVR